jgi:hypothetical protein
MPEVAIRYSTDNNYRTYTKRFLKRNKIETTRVTLLATINDSELIRALESDLKNTVFEVAPHYQLYKDACHDLIDLFNKFVENPTKSYFKQLLDELDLKNIDTVMEILKNESMEREVKKTETEGNSGKAS